MNKEKTHNNKSKNNFKYDRKKLLNGLLIAVFMVILFFITIQKYEEYKLKINIGDYAESDIRATKELFDENATEKLKEEAAKNVSPKYRISPSVQMNMKGTIANFLDTARDLKAQSNISLSRKAELLAESIDFEISSKDLYKILRMEYKSLNHFENTLTDLVNQLMGSGIKEEELEYEKESLVKVFDSLNLEEEEKSLGLILVSETMEPNEFVDVAETERLRDAAVNNIEPVIIKENEIIAVKGERITQNKYELIKESGLLKNEEGKNTSRNIGVSLLLLLSTIFLFGYIYFFNNDFLMNNKLLLLVLVILLVIVISEVFYNISPYIMPVTSAALLIAILIDTRLGLIVNLFISFFLGFVLRLDISIIFMFIIAGNLGVLTVIKNKQRYNILINAIIIGIVNVLVITSFALIKNSSGVNFWINNLQGLLNGLICGVITLGTLPIWENMFSILTPIKLLELSNPNHPLLKKLLLEAPGTYHHSLLVGNLSEAAAEAIGANPLLARVGSYFHDIGKSKKPYYFKENQFGISNPHDRLQPMQSTKIITGHAVDGINMAKEEKLPKEIIDIIDQHHGTTTVAYFYHKAKEDNEGIDVDIEDFRYKGSKPKTKEAALVMLADSTEAAVRSIKEPNGDKIKDMVTKVVNGKVKDGQLDLCDMTYKDVSTTISTFTKVLIGMYHDRIEYPDMDEQEGNTVKEGI